MSGKAEAFISRVIQIPITHCPSLGRVFYKEKIVRYYYWNYACYPAPKIDGV